MKTILEVMNKNVITVNPETPFSEILKIMKEKGIGKIPVVDGNDIVGIIRRDDLLVKQGLAPIPPVFAIWDLMLSMPNDKTFQENYKKVIAIKASEIMDTELNIVHENDELTKVITNMLEHEKDYFIVLKDSKIIGIITKTDLVRETF